MGITFISPAISIIGVPLMLYAAVSLIQDKRFFRSAPKDGMYREQSFLIRKGSKGRMAFL